MTVERWTLPASGFRGTKSSDPRFHAMLTEDGARVLFHREAYDQIN
jgi:hypothetical protein